MEITSNSNDSDQNQQLLLKEANKRQDIIRIAIQIYSFLSFIIIGFIISLIGIRLLPGRPFMNDALPYPLEFIIAQKEQFGFNQNVWNNFWTYLGQIHSGNWGISFYVAPGYKVWELIREKAPRSIEMVVVAFIFSLPAGVLFGWLRTRKKSSFYNRRKMKMITSLVCGLFLVTLPVYLTLILKTFLTPALFPIQGYVTTYYSVHLRFYNITGFGLIDTLIQGQFWLWWNIIQHLILPCTILSFPMTILTMNITTKLYNLRDKEKNAIIKVKVPSFNAYLYTALIGGYILMFLFVLEMTFQIYGFTELFLNALKNYDIFLIQSCVVWCLLIFMGIPFIINIVKIIVNNFRRKLTENMELIHLLNPETNNAIDYSSNDPNPQKISDNLTVNQNFDPERDHDLDPNLKVNYERKFFQKWVANRWTIIGFVGLGIAILCTILGIIFSDNQNYLYYGSPPWQAPSSEHILGQIHYGYDTLGRILFGFPPVLKLILIIIIGGSIGYLVGFVITPRHIIPQDFIKWAVNSFTLIPIIVIISYAKGEIQINFNLLYIFPIFLMMRVGIHISEKFSSNNSLKNRIQQSLPNALEFLLGMIFIFFNIYMGLSYLGYGQDDTIEWGTDLSANRARLNNWWINFLAFGPILINFTLIMFIMGLIDIKTPRANHKILIDE